MLELGHAKSNDAHCLACGFQMVGGRHVGLCPKCGSDRWYRTTLTPNKQAEPPPTRGVNRDSGTASANGGWLRRLVRHQRQRHPHKMKTVTATFGQTERTESERDAIQSLGYELARNMKMLPDQTPY